MEKQTEEYYLSKTFCCQFQAILMYATEKHHNKFRKSFAKMHRWLLVPLKWCWKHDAAIKWKHFPLYWPFVRGIHRPPVDSPHKGQWRGALVFPLTCTRKIGWLNNTPSRSLWHAHVFYSQNEGGLRAKDKYIDFKCQVDFFSHEYSCYPSVSQQIVM